MPRLPRNFTNTPFLHVIVQGINKEYIFYNNMYIKTYLSLINKYKNKYPVTIIAYCVMNNHAHLLIHVNDIKMLSKFMHHVNLVYSQFYNKKNNRCGVVFRNRYQSEPIENMEYLINCIHYIHMNPVKAKMVNTCSEYPYSSYNDFINNIGICKNKIFTDIFGDNFDYNKIFSKNTDIPFADINVPTHIELNNLFDKRFIGIF